VAPNVQSFQEKYGIKGASVVETGLIAGIACYLGMDIVEAPGATGGMDSDVMSIARTIVKTLETHDFVMCNIKGPDVAGHDGLAEEKVANIEHIDQAVGYIRENAGEHTHIILTCDHATPISVKDHSGDSVPIVFWGPEVRVDSVQAFDERSVVGGGVGRIRGTDLMNILTNLMGTQEKFGA